jgi:proline iminopeptidase
MRALLTIVLALSLLPSCATTSSGDQEEGYVQTPGGYLLSYRKMGTGDDVLFVLGDSWIGRDIERLAKDRTVLFFDGHGRGNSEPCVTYSIEGDLADLEAVREWFGYERISLLGMDYQGAVAAFYANAHPERVDKLVVVSPMPARKFPYWKIYYQIFNERRNEGTLEELNEMKLRGIPRTDPELWADTYARMIAEAWVKDPSSVRAMKSHPYSGKNTDPERSIVSYFELLNELGGWDWRKDLATIPTEALVVYGAADPMPVAASHEWVAALPNAAEVVVEDSGRMPWIEQPRDFLAAVDEFLKREVANKP